jgi:multidrug efflux pump
VVLAALGSRAALLVGFAIPTSFLLCFAFLAVMDVSISNIVMFGLILAVGMLVDGAIVVVEYADKKIKEGSGPMHAYVEAAQRMFWPVVSSTATTLCAFLPMLFWPGVPGEFMGMLPVTLIFVLSASLVVALVYLPVMGGVTGRVSRWLGDRAEGLRATLPWVARVALVPVALFALFSAAMQVLNPTYLLPEDAVANAPSTLVNLVGGVLFLIAALFASIALSAAEIRWAPKKIKLQRGHSPFGWFIKAVTGNPIMPLVAIGSVFAFVAWIFVVVFPANSKGVEFFVESEPEQATVYVRARGNLSLLEKDDMVRQAEQVLMQHPAVINVFSFAGEGGLDTDASGAQLPPDTVGQVQFEIIPWEDRPTTSEPILNGWMTRDVKVEAYDGDVVIAELQALLDELPGFETEILALARGPASGKPVHLRLKADNWDMLTSATATARAKFEDTAGLIQIEDSLPLPGIDWQIDVDVEKAGRFGADVATVGAMVQLVTRGILLDTMRVDSSDEEIEIRVRLPDADRVLSTLDTLKVRTQDGLVPLSNFISRKPVAKLASISRVDQQRYFDVKADVEAGLSTVVRDASDGSLEKLAIVRSLAEGDTSSGGAVIATEETGRLEIISLLDASDVASIERALTADARLQPINANERIAVLTEWLDTKPFPADISWEWTGDQEEQAESQAFLSSAFAAALGLMFIILLAQFNSFYNSILVLLAVILSTTGVLIGMVVMSQPFSIIMTGTGIVALAGIVVNNNIVLIDTYQEMSRTMPRLEAIVRTAEMRIRPVLLTTITTMAGLTPMMFGISLDFFGGGYSIDSPTALWWKQLATAVVFGLGVATVLTLVVTPAFLALRVWLVKGAYGALLMVLAGSFTKEGKRIRSDLRLRREARRIPTTELIWEDGFDAITAAPARRALPTPQSAERADDKQPQPQEPLKVLERDEKIAQEEATDAPIPDPTIRAAE